MTADRVFWPIFLILVTAAAALGFYGWAQEPSVRELNGASYWLSLIRRTLALFMGEMSSGSPTGNNFSLYAAGILAPIVTISAVLRAVVEVFVDRIEAFRIRRMSGHSVVCGLGDHGTSFALSEIDEGQSVVAIDRTPTSAQRTFCRLNDVRLVDGDCTQSSVLEAAAAGKARRIIICAGNDNLNLETAMRLEGLTTPTKGADPVKVFPIVRNSGLWRQLSQSSSIDRVRGGIWLQPVSLADFAARDLIWNEPLYSYGTIRGQSRLHFVIVGFDAYANALLTRLTPAELVRDFPQPVFTILAAEPDACRASLRREFPELPHEMVHVRPFDAAADPLSAAEMSEVEARSPVTAVFVCQDQDDTALNLALYVRERMLQTERWRAPVYLRISERDGIADLLKDSTQTQHFAEVIQTFGTREELCNLNLLEGPLEEIAARIHQGYREDRDRLLDSDQNVDKAESAAEWNLLSETYRESNRRAADHIKAKLFSAGCWVPPGTELNVPRSFTLIDGDGMLEALSALEHRSWCAGRQVNGWRHGPRDNMRKFHDDLVWDFASLDTVTQDYDRTQVRLVNDHLLNREGDNPRELIRRDLWIGLVGHNQVDLEEAAWCRTSLVHDVMPAILSRYEGAFLTFVTPLAPGSDMILAETVLDHCKEAGVPCRLIVPEGVRESKMLADYESVFNAGGTWDGHSVAAEGQSWSGGDGTRGYDEIRTARNRLIGLPETDWTVPLFASGARFDDQLTRAKGYGSQNEYLAALCQVLIAVCRAGAEPREGGTASLVQRFGQKPSAQSWPNVWSSRQMIQLDPSEQRVSESRH